MEAAAAGDAVFVSLSTNRPRLVTLEIYMRVDPSPERAALRALQKMPGLVAVDRAIRDWHEYIDLEVSTHDRKSDECMYWWRWSQRDYKYEHKNELVARLQRLILQVMATDYRLEYGSPRRRKDSVQDEGSRWYKYVERHPVLREMQLAVKEAECRNLG